MFFRGGGGGGEAFSDQAIFSTNGVTWGVLLMWIGRLWKKIDLDTG